ncbi:hypothetical protein EG68_12156 [Paragonimus skrjabini miyazakii]|uniref:Uncharacterized protein n=1 Tax=Paragonimus skrjabini miyazakii TaxID=59628 RepID=A0A8S9YGG0_9TREM|nr:hypothetical protein EG68_12156 [Paragonimus skrjabini miyazakii]
MLLSSSGSLVNVTLNSCSGSTCDLYMANPVTMNITFQTDQLLYRLRPRLCAMILGFIPSCKALRLATTCKRGSNECLVKSGNLYTYSNQTDIFDVSHLIVPSHLLV